MNIYEFAKEMELEGEEYYKKMAEAAKDQGLKKIFMELANDERKHYNIINNIEENFDFCDDNPTMDEEKTIFTERLKSTDFNRIVESDIEAYEHAAKLEKESINFYDEKSKELERDCERKVLYRLMKEEKKHLESLEFIIRHLRKAEEWVEAAEFTHGEKY